MWGVVVLESELFHGEQWKKRGRTDEYTFQLWWGDGWTWKRASVVRRTDTESAEGGNEEEKERELYPPPLLVVPNGERWVKGWETARQRQRGDKKTRGGGEGNRMGHRESRGFEGKHPYERQREKKREHKACFFFVRSTLSPTRYR